MRAYMQLMRPANGLMASFGSWTGMLVAGAAFYPTQQVLSGLLAVFLVSSGGMAVNDYFDMGIDRVNRPKRPLPSGRISKKSALAFAVILFVAGIGLAYLISFSAFVIAAFAAAVLVAYAAKLKKTLLIGHVAISLLVALAFVFGGIAAGNHIPTLLMAFLAFMSNIAREIYKSIEDILGDRQHDVNSLPLKFGVLKAKMAANMFIIASVIFSFVPYFLGIFGQVYLFFAVIADAGFIAAVVSPARYSARLCKISMVVALAAFLAAAIRI